MISWPPRLSLAQLPTPVTRVERFPDLPDGVEVWIKRDDLTGTEVSGNKVRKLEFNLAEAQQQGCNAVITCGGVQSNHCRATALLGARLGMKVHLLLRGEQPQIPQGNLLLDQLAGAEITFVSEQQWPQHEAMVRELQEKFAAQNDKAYYIPVGASDEVGLWGYIAASEEIAHDIDRLSLQPDYIVVATGSGGTQSGLLVGAKEFSLPGQVVAFNVSDNAAYFKKKVETDVALWKQRYKTDFDLESLTVKTIEGYLGPGYGVATPEIFATIKQLASSNGIILDPVYTGKAFHGMVQELKKGDQGELPGAKQVLFVHTGGLFGVFPQHEHFKFD